jgi:hypothetical protein
MQTKIRFSDDLFYKVRIGQLNSEVEVLKIKLLHEKRVKAGYISAYLNSKNKFVVK